MEAAAAFGRMRCPGSSRGVLVNVAMTDTRARARREAVRALGAYSGPEDEDVCAALRARLEDDDWNVRLEAARALGRRRCRDSTEDLHDLVVTSEDLWTRIYAAQALADLGHRCAVAGLLAAAADNDRRVFKEAVRGLRQLADPRDLHALNELEERASWRRQLTLRRLISDV